MSEDNLRTQITVNATMDEVFDVLARPENHLDIDGTGWLAECIDPAPLTETGQVFRIGMYHDDHPDKTYTMANRVIVLDAPRAIGWLPGQADEEGTLGFGGWTWRYDLAAQGADSTLVTLTYDWSGTSADVRETFEFPPFPADYLDSSLRNLVEIATAKVTS
jgi:hypothetical protein